jgi:putative DNA primase/helicase
MIAHPDIPALARGHWPAILADLGVDQAHLRDRHGPCPGCGGTDRFRFDDRDGRGTWYCGGGGEPQSGDGFDLVGHVFGLDKRNAFIRVRDWLGLGESHARPAAPPKHTDPPKPKPSTAGYGLRYWSMADRSDSAVGSHPYALSRGIDWAAGAGRGTATGRVVGTDADCVLIPIRDIRTDAVVAVQAINAAGDKQTFGPVKGHAFVSGNTLNKQIPWYVTEGWADAVSLVFHRHRGNAAAFGVMGSHFDAVVRIVTERYAPDRLMAVEDAA